MDVTRARHACKHCRINKRKCDRALPACKLCSRLGKQCQYAGRVLTPDSSISSTPDTIPLNFGAPSQCMPPTYFLDPKCFTPIQPSNALDSTSHPLLQQTIAVLAPAQNHLAIFAAYFSSVHEWLPIISKKRLMGMAVTEPEGCQDLLILCMKLCATSRQEDENNGRATPARDPLYLAARSLSSAAETTGVVSLRLVQSLILITVYEVFHAIYPAAYLTIGRAARLGTLMGWHSRSAQQLFTYPETLSHREEQRRTWWAIFILDRFINADTKGLPFAAPEPHQDEFLPVNDDDWDRGRLVPSEPLFAASFSSVTTLGSYAKTCQAAHMLGKVISHKKTRMECSDNISDVLSAGRQLHQALCALQTSLDHQPESPTSNGASSPSSSLKPAPMTAITLCATARYLLYSLYGCRDLLSTSSVNIATETEMQSFSVDGVMFLTTVAVPEMLAWRSDSPLMARCFFEAAKMCAWHIREDHDAATREMLRGIIAEMTRLGRRWKVATEFLSILGQKGVLKLVGAT